MSTKSIFLIDANILVEAYKRYYSFDIAPSFWLALKSNAEDGIVFSVDRVQQEINSYGKDDHLKTWIETEFSSCFLSTDAEDVIEAYREVIEWATEQEQFTEAAKAEFASVGDSWLIACAKAHNYILVTHETYNAEIRKKIPIPNVCRALGIQYMNTFNMLRSLGVQLG